MPFDPTELRTTLRDAAPTLWSELGTLARTWSAPALAKLNRPRSHAPYPKTFNDPVWGVIELLPWETVLLDSPLLQRLRGVRQLGMAHLVYPGAGHDRLEHSRGVVEAADRMIRALERNASHRRSFGQDRDENVPEVSNQDRYATRLAALLHDIGHGPFSHATERLIQEHHAVEFRRAEEILRESFPGSTSIAPSEAIATIVILSDAMRALLTHPNIAAATNCDHLPEAIAARILGSRIYLDATYLSGIISGPVDADKLDYIARDCHHSGLPLGIDLTRLISKLEVVIVTPQAARNEELRQRAAAAPHQRIYEMGISQAGLGSYEQLVIARVLLYDRLYYHHKVRAAEAMLQRLVRLAEEENDSPYSISELFAGVSDDIFVNAIGAQLTSPTIKSGGTRSVDLAKSILDREIHYRAFAFAARFILGPQDLPEPDQQDTRALMWRKVLRTLSTNEGCRTTSRKIHETALELAGAIPELATVAEDLKPEEILVDLPLNKVVVRGGDILTRTDSGHVGTPNLFFDPERWSQAYEHQKQCGFVFTPRRRVPLVALASRIVFFEQFNLVMNEQADRAAKVTDAVQDSWIDIARYRGICTPECGEVLRGGGAPLLTFRTEDIQLPDNWLLGDNAVASRIADQLNDNLPDGLPASFHKATLTTFRALASFADVLERNGTLVSSSKLSERQLQRRLREFLDMAKIPVSEGTEFGGGESDLVVDHRIVVENKVISDPIPDPFGVGPNFFWQARRYSLSLCSRVVFVVVGYRPSDENALLPLWSRVRVCQRAHQPSEHSEIRVAIPWGFGVPSSAKHPAPSNQDGKKSM